MKEIREFWEEVFYDPLMRGFLGFGASIIAMFGTLCFFSYIYHEARAETAFEVTGQIESVREISTNDEWAGVDTSVVISIDGQEYEANGSIAELPIIQTGQTVTIIGHEREIEKISVSR